MDEIDNNIQHAHKLRASWHIYKEGIMNIHNIVEVDGSQKQGSYLGSCGEKRILTATQSIRAKCLDCANGSRTEVRLCEITTCALWPRRMGKRPKNEQ